MVMFINRSMDASISTIASAKVHVVRTFSYVLNLRHTWMLLERCQMIKYLRMLIVVSVKSF